MLVEIEQFIDWVRMRSPYAKTWRDYKCDLDIFMGVIEKQNVEDIQPRDLDHSVVFQVSKGYKPTTVNRRLAAVTSFYGYLMLEGRQVSCPVLPKRHYLQESQRLPRPVNEQDLRRFFGDVHDPRDRAMFSIMLKCGLRIGEVAELKLSDLYLGESHSHIIVRGKGARERTVYLSPGAERDLQNWLAIRPKVHCEHAFVSYQHKKLSTTSISVRINHVRKTSGVELTAHRLRHTFATQLLNVGCKVTSIQRLLGHTNLNTTMTYVRAFDQRVMPDYFHAVDEMESQPGRVWYEITAD